jgi:hypothetical protein
MIRARDTCFESAPVDRSSCRIGGRMAPAEQSVKQRAERVDVARRRAAIKRVTSAAESDSADMMSLPVRLSLQHCSCAPPTLAPNVNRVAGPRGARG